MATKCTPERCSSNLWQFKCTDCSGKLEHHTYRLWYERVTPLPGQRPMSVCHSCKEKEEQRLERLKEKEGQEGSLENRMRGLSIRGRNDPDAVPIDYMKYNVPRRQEEGVFICYCVCFTCPREFTVKCEMQDTAKCYGVKCGSKMVSPCHFEPRRRIEKKSDCTHSCSKCNGKPGCPNMTRQVAFH